MTFMKTKKKHPGIWIMIVAAVVLEAISCVMYFTSRAAIRHEAEQRAMTELRKAELEIEKHTVEVETAAKTLVLLVQKHLNQPDSVFAATRLVVQTLKDNTSLAVAFIPDYFPRKGRFYEVCSSRISEDSIYTRNIGTADHDYTQMEWFQNGFEHDSCWWSEPYLDDSGSKKMVVSCSLPVYDAEGTIVAVTCIDVPLDYLQDMSEYLQVYNSSYAICSNTGQDIVPPIDTIPGRKYISFNEEIDATGWYIKILIPEDELFADLNHIGKIVGILMLLGLVILALMLVYASNTVRKMIEFAEKNQRMEGELEVAQTIQMAMLPKVFPPFMDRLDVNLYGIVEPAKEVGGDLYDFYVRHNKLFFCIGDVSGKGVPAALVMAMTRSLFRSVTSHEEEPEVIVRKMNRAIADQNAQNMFLTLFLAVLDCETGKLSYCNAGHNAPAIKSNGEWQLLDVRPNLPLGIEPEFIFQAQERQLQHGDILFLYTDGLTEAENLHHAQYGEERMLDTLQQSRMNGLSPRHMVNAMKESVEEFRQGAEQSDDLTMLVVRYQQSALMMRNDIEQIPTLAEWLEGVGIPEEMNMPINLALEEIVSNVMLYAYPHSSGRVVVEHTPPMIFTITDSGIPFDPTQQKEADITLSAEERQIGGLGIHLVRQIMDEVQYERVDDKNVLTLVKHIE